MSPVIDLIGSAKGFGWGALTASSSYESISSFTAVGGETTITLSSIPATYKHLQLRYISKDTYAASDGSQASNIYFNGDTGSNYAAHRLRANGTAVAASGNGPQTGIDRDSILNVYGNLANYYAAGIIDIIDYASTTKYKTLRAFSGADINVDGPGKVVLSSGLWMNTAAITSISINGWITACAAGSIFALYGIKG